MRCYLEDVISFKRILFHPHAFLLQSLFSPNSSSALTSSLPGGIEAIIQPELRSRKDLRPGCPLRLGKLISWLATGTKFSL